MSRPKRTAFSASEEVELWNREDATELVEPSNPSAFDISVAARDWTVETIVQQIRLGNIDLAPEFQRRNAWRDHRRSRLIESFILEFPIPQIVLAENPRKKKAYIVIDGKQRLMTIAGLYIPEFREYWTLPRFIGLKILGELNGVSIDEFLDLESPKFEDARRKLSNADIRTTIITGFTDESVLYDIFYRINTGSVPLSSQELRQVLNRGDFSQYLLQKTAIENPVWTAINIDEPDSRLRDVELLLRLIAWRRFSEDYAGNMKKFLDDTMKVLNTDWSRLKAEVEKDVAQIFKAIDTVTAVFGETAGKKYKEKEFERTLNRAVFEVQVVHFLTPGVRVAATRRKAALLTAFKELSKDTEFLSAVESTTKSTDNTRYRFSAYRRMLQKTLGVKVPAVTIGV